MTDRQYNVTATLGISFLTAAIVAVLGLACYTAYMIATLMRG